MYIEADRSQRVQGRSPGLGGVVLIGVKSPQAPWPAFSHGAAGGRRLAALTAPQHVWRLAGS